MFVDQEGKIRSKRVDPNISRELLAYAVRCECLSVWTLNDVIKWTNDFCYGVWFMNLCSMG